MRIKCGTKGGQFLGYNIVPRIPIIGNIIKIIDNFLNFECSFESAIYGNTCLQFS